MSTVQAVKDEIVSLLHEALANDDIGSEVASKLLSAAEKLDTVTAGPAGSIAKVYNDTELADIPMADESAAEVISPGVMTPVHNPFSDNARKRQSVVVVDIEGKTGDADEPTKWLSRNFSGYGSFRRQSVFQQSSPTGAVIPQVLSFRGAGMPALDIDAAPDPRSQFSRSVARHTAVFQEYMHLFDEGQGYGYEVYLLEDIDEPEFDIRAVDGTTERDIFINVAANVFFKYSLMETLQVNIKTLLDFFALTYEAYPKHNRFTNAIHGANCLQSAHQYFTQPNVKENFTDVEILATLVSALCIRVGNTGLPADVLSKLGHPLVLLYGDAHPNESFALALTMSIMRKADFFKDSKSWHSDPLNALVFRELVTEMILNSAARFHNRNIENVELILKNGAIHEHHVPMLLTAVVHAATMHYATKRFETFLQGVGRFVEQNFAQGDIEKSLGFEISPMCDRSAGDDQVLSKAHHMFLTVVVKPYFKEMDKVLPKSWLAALEENTAAMTSTAIPYDGANNHGVLSDALLETEKRLVEVVTEVVPGTKKPRHSQYAAMVRILTAHAGQNTDANTFFAHLTEVANSFDTNASGRIKTFDEAMLQPAPSPLDFVRDVQSPCDPFFLTIIRSFAIIRNDAAMGGSVA